MEKQMMENFLLDSIKDSLIYWKYFKFRWDTAAKNFWNDQDLCIFIKCGLILLSVNRQNQFD